MRRNKGVSMITLIITIIVIIILAAIAFVGMDDATGSAQYARFSSEFGDYATNFTGGAVTKVQESLGLAGKVANKAQIVYCAARGVNLSEFDEVLNGVTLPGGYTSTRFQTDIKDATGATYVLATADTPCYEIKDDVMKEYTGKKFYGDSNGEETHWVTASGVVFTLPGYPRVVDGEERMYINAELYYVPGESRSTEEGETTGNSYSVLLANSLVAKEPITVVDKSSGATVGSQKVADAADHVGASGTSGEETQGELLAEAIKSGKIQVGDYVNYPVEYENLTVDGNTSIYEGWRILSVETDGTVNLVSGGVPLTFYHPGSNATASVVALTTDFFNTLFRTSSSDMGYRRTGFGTGIELQDVFTNEYTKMDGETPVVRAMTKADVDAIVGKTTSRGSLLEDAKYNGLFYLGTTIEKIDAPQYWLASEYYSSDLWKVDNGGGVMYSWTMYISGAYEYGVRPVVSLKPEVKVTTQDASGAWNIEI